MTMLTLNVKTLSVFWINLTSVLINFIIIESIAVITQNFLMKLNADLV